MISIDKSSLQHRAFVEETIQIRIMLSADRADFSRNNIGHAPTKIATSIPTVQVHTLQSVTFLNVANNRFLSKKLYIMDKIFMEI